MQQTIAIMLQRRQCREEKKTNKQINTHETDVTSLEAYYSC